MWNHANVGKKSRSEIGFRMSISISLSIKNNQSKVGNFLLENTLDPTPLIMQFFWCLMMQLEKWSDGSVYHFKNDPQANFKLLFCTLFQKSIFCPKIEFSLNFTFRHIWIFGAKIGRYSWIFHPKKYQIHIWIFVPKI